MKKVFSEIILYDKTYRTEVVGLSSKNLMYKYTPTNGKYSLELKELFLRAIETIFENWDTFGISIKGRRRLRRIYLGVG